MMTEIAGPWSEDDVRDFLQTAVLPLRLAAVGTDGYPRVVSVWFEARGGELVCVSHRESKLVKLLRANPRVGFEVAPEKPPYHGVRGQGEVRLAPLEEDPALDRLLDKYLGGKESKVGNWLLARRDEETLVMITPLRLFSWDYRDRMSDVESGE